MPNQLLRSRQIAFNRQDGKCYYCGIPMWLVDEGKSPRFRCTAEHLKARTDGGSDRAENIVAACAHCNQTRHKRNCPPEPAAYREEVRRRVRRGGWHPVWVYRAGLLETQRAVPSDYSRL